MGWMGDAEGAEFQGHWCVPGSRSASQSWECGELKESRCLFSWDFSALRGNLYGGGKAQSISWSPASASLGTELRAWRNRVNVCKQELYLFFCPISQFLCIQKTPDCLTVTSCYFLSMAPAKQWLQTLSWGTFCDLWLRVLGLGMFLTDHFPVPGDSPWASPSYFARSGSRAPAPNGQTQLGHRPFFSKMNNWWVSEMPVTPSAQSSSFCHGAIPAGAQWCWPCWVTGGAGHAAQQLG